MASPKSCDTFAVLPPGTQDGCVIFGKNSDRPSDEVQEVVYIPKDDHVCPSKVKCTYIEIDQVPHTHAVILSKPSWMWGGEMGANEHGVCIGNEAVWTKLNGSDDSIKKLLGMDLLRLGLERASTALESLRTIVSLLEMYGMGGSCSESLLDFTYHNSFLIADPSEVWILECAGNIWAAERVTSGVRNISNELSIGSNIDLMSENLEDYANDRGYWQPYRGPLNFKKAFGFEDVEDCYGRYARGKHLLTRYSQGGHFKQTDMFKVLRDKPSGICMSSGPFVSTGSQVSVLRKPDSGIPSCHWFTATPDPSRSVFKPFIFTDQVKFPPQVISPVWNKMKPSDRKHELYKAHERILRTQDVESDFFLIRMRQFESSYVTEAERIAANVNDRKDDASNLFFNVVHGELAAYP